MTMTMTRTEIVTLKLEVEIDDFQPLQRYVAEWYSHAIDGGLNSAIDEREHVARAASWVAANAFTSLKSETGLQLRSITLVE